MNKPANSKAPNFKVGDQVICIDARGVYELRNGDTYKVTAIFKDSNSAYRCFIKGKASHDGLFCTRFMLQIEYDANKYNI